MYLLFIKRAHSKAKTAVVVIKARLLNKRVLVVPARKQRRRRGSGAIPHGRDGERKKAHVRYVVRKKKENKKEESAAVSRIAFTPSPTNIQEIASGA